MISLRAAAAGLALLVAAASASAQQGPRAVVVGGDRDYPPYEFLDQDGNPAGYNVDLTRAIAEVMGMRVEFRLGGWSEMRQALQDGTIDALQGMSYSDDRAQRVDFAPPSTVVNHAIFAREGTPPVSSLEELRGHKVALHRAGIMDDTLTRMGFRADDLLRTDTPADALRLLASGQGEYAVVAILPGTYIIRQFKLTNLRPVARGVASQRYGIAVRKGNSELLSRFTEGLAILKETGRYEQIRQRWLGVLEPSPLDWLTLLRFGAVITLPFVLVLGGTMVWTRSLRRQVAQRTASLAREVAERQRAVEELRLNQAQLVQADKMTARRAARSRTSSTCPPSTTPSSCWCRRRCPARAATRPSPRGCSGSRSPPSRSASSPAGSEPARRGMSGLMVHEGPHAGCNGSRSLSFPRTHPESVMTGLLPLSSGPAAAPTNTLGVSAA